MSPRAAWRLESLGFTAVYDYVAGKADWFARGLPRAGRLADMPTIGDLARRDVPTCGPPDRVGDVRERARAGGWDLCVVVNERRIVLGRLRRRELDGDPAAAAGAVMEEGPTTYRPDRPAAETADYLAERRVAGILVTDPDGVLIGFFRPEDRGRLADEAGSSAGGGA
jgi:CBS domain-containing protein